MLMYALHCAIHTHTGSERHKPARMNQSLGIEKVCKTLTTYGFDCWLAWVEPMRVRAPAMGGLQTPKKSRSIPISFVGFPLIVPPLLIDA